MIPWIAPPCERCTGALVLPTHSDFQLAVHCALAAFRAVDHKMEVSLWPRGSVRASCQTFSGKTIRVGGQISRLVDDDIVPRLSPQWHSGFQTDSQTI